MGKERLSKIVDFNFDRGFGFFAGLNVLPKNWAISTYSYRIDKQSTTSFIHDFVSAINSINQEYYNGKTINLDFHSIPHFDVLLTMVADTLYKLMAEDLKGSENATSGELFNRFVNTPGKVIADGNEVIVKMKKRAHTPVLKSNEVFRESGEVPWWGNKIFRFEWVS